MTVRYLAFVRISHTNNIENQPVVFRTTRMATDIETLAFVDGPNLFFSFQPYYSIR